MTTPMDRIEIFADLKSILETSKRVIVPRDREHLIRLALGGKENDIYEVKYAIPGQGTVLEATVVKCRNGVAANYTDPYMRRRDPDCMFIADENLTDKPRFSDEFGSSFETVRTSVFEWLSGQELIALPFRAGSDDLGCDALLVGPLNAAFFAAALADLQGMLTGGKLPDNFKPRAVIYLAPTFRHTHLGGRQVVVHNRIGDLHEIFSFNLYPGPSAKKGVYGVLLNIGEKEGWITAHASTVQVVTPYDNILTIMHEGASGGGKSEMLEYPHRQPDGRLLLGQNTVTGERRFLSLRQGCALKPVTDDMAECHPSYQTDRGKLVITDAEEGWFVRVNHIIHYGVDPHLERLCTAPSEPLVFLNLYAVPNATCLIWEPIEDSPGKPCSNPRVVVPRRMIPGIVSGKVEVDVRSFGVRTPPCTEKAPSYGIMGLLHFLPPALAWLWRIVAPRGYSNPSITDTIGMISEGVGSYWPFATGRRVDQANLLLRQVLKTLNTTYVLVPNQHIGAWSVGFMPQWITREYLARRGNSKFQTGQLKTARCPLLGFTPALMEVEGVEIPNFFFEVNAQSEVGDYAYEVGAKELRDFFARELTPYLDYKDLDPLGREIIKRCLSGGSAADFERIMPATLCE